MTSTEVVRLARGNDMDSGGGVAVSEPYRLQEQYAGCADCAGRAENELVWAGSKTWLWCVFDIIS